VCGIQHNKWCTPHAKVVPEKRKLFAFAKRCLFNALARIGVTHAKYQWCTRLQLDARSDDYCLECAQCGCAYEGSERGWESGQILSFSNVNA
jgi:hypothetical protein